MKTWCNYCDPKCFIIYGFCKNCRRRCEPPLYEPKGTMSAKDYEEYCKRWNQERPDIVTDSMRRDEK